MIELSQRVIVSESWALASAMARRHPELLVVETRPGDGLYDALALALPDGQFVASLNRFGSVHAWSKSSHEEFDSIYSWIDVLTEPTEISACVKIERRAELTSPSRTPPSTARVLGYRIASQLLLMTRDSRVRWDVRSSRFCLEGWQDPKKGLEELVERFPTLSEARGLLAQSIESHAIDSHVWRIMRGREPVAVLDNSGTLFTPIKTVDLTEIYDRNRRRLAPTVAALFGDLLP